MQIPVTGHGIKEQVTHVQGVRRQVQVPEGPVVRDDEQNVPGILQIRRNLNRKEIAQLPGMATPTGLNQLDLSQGPVPQRVAGIPDKKRKPQHQVGIPGNLCGNKDGIKGWKLFEPCRCRNVFIPQGGKSVVCRDKQIVTADMVLLQERGPVGCDIPCIRRPLLLHLVLE